MAPDGAASAPPFPLVGLSHGESRDFSSSHWETVEIWRALAARLASNGYVRTEDSNSEPRAHAGGFATTHWSVVLAAGQQGTPQSTAALEQLCRTYWYPLYVYIRRQGHSPEDAQDLTQEFFSRLLESHSFASADRRKGRFRSFLLGTLKHFLADEQDKAGAQKRGGGRTIISWDQLDAEERFQAEPIDQRSPDSVFDRRWAMTVLDQATARLRGEYEGSGRAQIFRELKGYVTADPAVASYAQAAARLGLSESAVKSAIHRLRQRYHALIRDEVAQTVADPKDLEEEIRYLRSLFSAPAATG